MHLGAELVAVAVAGPLLIGLGFLFVLLLIRNMAHPLWRPASAKDDGGLWALDLTAAGEVQAATAYPTEPMRARARPQTAPRHRRD